jgi:hypothetical protein
VSKPWPWPADSNADRYKRVATAYRAALEAVDPDACTQLDEWAVEHGQGWIVPSPWPYADDDQLTYAEAAHACHIAPDTIYQWTRRGLRVTRTPAGPRITAGDLIEFQRVRRQRRRGSA